MERKASCKEHVRESCLFPVSTEFAMQVFSVYALPSIISVQKETTFYHHLYFVFFLSCMEEARDQYNSWVQFLILYTN